MFFKKRNADRNNMYFDSQLKWLQIRNNKSGNWYWVDEDWYLYNYPIQIPYIVNTEEILPDGYDLSNGIDFFSDSSPDRGDFYFPAEVFSRGYFQKMSFTDRIDQYHFMHTKEECRMLGIVDFEESASPKSKIKFNIKRK